MSKIGNVAVVLTYEVEFNTIGFCIGEN